MIPIFTNAQAMSIKNPNVFTVPSDEALKTLKVGDHVKVSAYGERFWIELTLVSKTQLGGRVDNELITDKMKRGDFVSFKRCHVYSIFLGKGSNA